MTACTNKARGAVVAALAGVLALGAVPAVALATGTADAQVDLLVNADEFASGSVTLSGPVTGNAADGYEVAATGNAVDVKIVNVTIANGNIVPFDEDLFDVAYYVADDDNEPTGEALSEAVDPGTYVVVVSGKEGGKYAGQGGKVVLTVNPAGFAWTDFVVYEVNPDDESKMGDRKFMYTGSDLEVGVYAANLTEGVDYEYKILAKGTGNVDTAESVAVHDAGSYRVYITGLGKYEGAKLSIPLDVVKFDLGDAKISHSDVIDSNDVPEHPTRVVSEKSGYEGTELDPTQLDMEFVAGTGTGLFDGNGRYEFKLTPADTMNANGTSNVTGTYKDDDTARCSIYVNKVGAYATFKHNGEEIKDSYVIDLSKGESFDVSKIEAYGGKDKLGCSLTDETGTTVNFIDNTKAGTYKLTVAVDASNNGYEYGGSKTFTVRVTRGTIDADAQVYVSYNDEIVSSIEKTYDLKSIDLGTNLKVTAYNKDGKAIPAVSATIYDANGKKVASGSIVDAGTYTLKVTSSSWDLTGTTEVPITINKADLTTVRLVGLESWSGTSYLSDETVVYSFAKLGARYDTHMAAGEKDGEKDYVGWDDFSKFQGGLWDASNLSIEKWDAEEQEWVKATAPASGVKYTAGDYRLVIKGNETLAKNFEFANDDNTTTVAFKVIDADNLKFTDVTPNDWFFNCVGVMAGNNADMKELIRGYADTGTFGPNNQITRADVAVILFRMAQGSDTFADPDLGYTENEGWVTGFSDIDDAGLGNMYYAKAIGWANKMGVVNGYDDGTFKPEQNVTREELATMLANFAKHVYRDDVALVEGELDAMPDGGSVSTWAQKAVSWCLENELMGNDGSIRLSDTITRAETAAMAYNYLTKVVGWNK